MADQILEFNRAELFRKFPHYSGYHVSMSEYLFKLLQPKLDVVYLLEKDMKHHSMDLKYSLC